MPKYVPKNPIKTREDSNAIAQAQALPFRFLDVPFGELITVHLPAGIELSDLADTFEILAKELKKGPPPSVSENKPATPDVPAPPPSPPTPTDR